MGLTLQFLVGDKKQIIESIKNEEFDFLETVEKENNMADFSLHLIPNDLNLLVNAATEMAGLQKFGLREHLDFNKNFFDSEDRGACLVNSEIKLLFSKFNNEQAVDLANAWVNKMEKEHNEEIGVNPGIIDAIKQLIYVSKKSVERNLDLVHVWLL
jgi:hypothetical protein